MWTLAGDLDKVNGATAFICAKKDNDETAIKVVDNYVYYLSESILNMCNFFRTQAVVIGGAISAEGSYLTDEIITNCEKWYYGYKGTPKVEILTDSLGNDVGIIGAAALLVD